MALPRAGVTALGLALAAVVLLTGVGAHRVLAQTAPPLPPTTPTASNVIPTTATNQAVPLVPIAPAPLPRIGAGQSQAATTAPDDILHIDHADISVADIAAHTDRLVGKVHLTYRGYRIQCDRATYHTDTQIVDLENNVILSDGEQVVYADRIELDRRTQNFSSTEARTIIPPERVSAALTEPLRLSGKTITQEGQNLVATDGLLSTCDFPNPHYKIGFAKATIIPNDRIILRKAVLYRYDRPEIRIAYLSLPIRDDIRYSYVPVVGEDAIEGYYVKNAIGYTLSRGFPGILRVDYMTKLGLGLGFDQAYKFGQYSAGTFVIYALHNNSTDTEDLSYNVNHQQRIGDTITGITTNYQKNSYQALSPDSTTQNTTINTTRNAGNSSTAASLTLGTNSLGGSFSPVAGYVGGLGSTSSSQSENYSLSQTEKFGADTIALKLTGSNTSNSVIETLEGAGGALSQQTTTSGTVQQSAALTANGQSGIFDFVMTANKVLESKLTGTNASTSAPLYSGPQQLPDLTLTTTSQRLKNLLFYPFFSVVPLQFSFGYGRYASEVANEVTNSTTGQSMEETREEIAARSLFDMNTNPKPFALTAGSALSLQVDGDFKQTVYGNNYAQYVLKQDDTLTQKLGENSSMNLVYGYLRPYGGVPTTFSFDSPGQVNNLGTNLTVTGYRIKMTLGTGYSIEQAEDRLLGNERNPWQTANLQLALSPSAIIQTSVTAAYDINDGQLVSANNRIRIRGRGNFALDTDLDYDPQTHRLSQASETFTTPLFSKDLMLTVLTGYDGLTHQFAYKNFTIIRSFHDYEYVITYQDQPYGLQTERGINFAIRLKAFPILSSPQTNQFGGAVNTGSTPIF